MPYYKAVEGKTPYEAWYGQKPKVDHLTVMLLLISRKMSVGNSIRKPGNAYYLAMEKKAYRLYDISQKKVLYSRDVQFNEETKECRLDSPDSRIPND